MPIIPDEARTFGMDSLFSQIGIYASQGQLYTPVDKDMVMYYKEAKDGQISRKASPKRDRWQASPRREPHTPTTACR